MDVCGLPCHYSQRMDERLPACICGEAPLSPLLQPGSQQKVHVQSWPTTLPLESYHPALAGVAQWIECRPVNQSITSSIPSQVTCLGCRPCHHQGVHEKQPHIDVSLPLFLLPFPFLKRKKIKLRSFYHPSSEVSVGWGRFPVGSGQQRSEQMVLSLCCVLGTFRAPSLSSLMKYNSSESQS